MPVTNDRAHAEVGAPGGQGRELQERRVPVHQQLDALSGQELAPRAVALDVAGATPFPGQGQLLVHRVDGLEEGGPIGLVLPGFGVDGGGEHGHGGQAPGGVHHVRPGRGKNRRMLMPPPLPDR